MADKSLQYTVTFNTQQAKQAAQQLGAVFRRELATLHLNILDPNSFNPAIARTQQLQAQMQQVATQAQQAARNIQNIRPPTVSSGGGGSSGGGTNNLNNSFANGLLGGITGYLSVQGAQQIVQQAGQLDELRGQAINTNKALELLAGGSQQATDAIRQIQSVTPGATNSLEAAQAAVTILGNKLPSAAINLKDISQFAAVVSRISPSIHDVGDALAQLTLFSSSGSFARADQLLATADDVKNKIKELKDIYPELSDAQLKAAATVQLVNDKYAPLIDTLADNVTGIQRVKTALEELRIEAAKGPIGQASDQFFRGLSIFLAGPTEGDVQSGLRNLQARQKTEVGNQQSVFAKAFGGAPTGANQALENTQRFDAALDHLFGTLENAGAAGEEYKQKAIDIADGVIRAQSATDENIKALQDIEVAYNNASAAARNAAVTQEDFVSQPYKVSPAQELLNTFQDLDQAIAAAGEFTPAQVPGIEKIQDALINLKSDIASTGTVTEDQAAQLAALEGFLQRAANGMEYLSATEGEVATASGGMNSALVDTQGELDATALKALQAADALSQARAILNSTQSALASGLSGLISQGLITAEGASALFAQGQNALTRGSHAIAYNPNLSPQERAFQQAQLEHDIKAQLVDPIADAERERQRAQREAESAAKRGQRDIQNAWESAAKTVEEKFKEAAKDLQDALGKVPGLTSPSSVTEQQMKLAEAGVPQNFADDYVRRLRDEVFNKVDRPEVSIEEARAGLQRVGITPTGKAEADAELFAQAFADQTLFAVEENLKFINQQAVQDNLARQKQGEQGLENIYKFFGATPEQQKAKYTQEEVDQMVQEEAAKILAKNQGLGGGGGGFEPSKPVPVTIENVTGGIFQPGAGVGVPLMGRNTAGDGAALSQTAISGLDAGSAERLAKSFNDQLAGQTDYLKGLGESIAGMLDKGFTAYEHAALATDFLADISMQLGLQQDFFKGQGAGIAKLHDEGYIGQARADLAYDMLADMGTQFGAQRDAFIGQGAGVAGLIDSGMAAHDFAPAATTMINSLRSGFSTDENTNILLGIGGGLSQMILLGMTDTISAPDWGETLFNTIMGSVLTAASDSLTGTP